MWLEIKCSAVAFSRSFLYECVSRKLPVQIVAQNCLSPYHIFIVTSHLRFCVVSNRPKRRSGDFSLRDYCWNNWNKLAECSCRVGVQSLFTYTSCSGFIKCCCNVYTEYARCTVLWCYSGRTVHRGRVHVPPKALGGGTGGGPPLGCLLMLLHFIFISPMEIGQWKQIFDKTGN